MQTQTSANPTAPIAGASFAHSSYLRWTFHRDRRNIRCEIRLGATGLPHEVHVIPEWDLRLAHVEHPGTTMRAMRRHAEIAQLLREAGWMLVSRV